jgi:hypothetical protein
MQRWEAAVPYVPLGDRVFTGYIFLGSPPKEPRLWFLDRHLASLVVNGALAARLAIDGSSIMGVWSMDTDQLKANLADWKPKPHWTGTTHALNEMLPGVTVRYANIHAEQWEMVWRLTDTIIPHVTTFGEDDTWRLGVWPD